MRTFFIAAAVLALPGAVLAQAPSQSFTIDELAPGEGYEGTCYAWLARSGAEALPGEAAPRAVFEDATSRAYVKLNGQVFTLRAGSGERGLTRSQVTYEDKAAGVTVTTDLEVMEASGADNWGAYALKGKITVTYNDKTLSVYVAGKSVCD